jgi:hypothetical protein
MEIRSNNWLTAPARRTRTGLRTFCLIYQVWKSLPARAIIRFSILTPQSDVAIIRQHGEEPYKSPYFKLVSPKPDVYYILNIAGFLQNILIYNNMEEAINSFN